MFKNFGWVEGLLIFGVLLLFFGAARLPAMGRSIGQSIKEFKKGVSGDESSDKSKSTTASASMTKNDENKEMAKH